jgi:four helix bundle protein
MSDNKESNNIICKKSYAFALEIINIYKTLTADKKEFILSKQLLRCGTSIGANVQEALSGESKRDFIHKLSIAPKESKETAYWLNLLKDSNYISIQQFENLNSFSKELIKILRSIILTTKKKYFPQLVTHNSKF